MHVTIFFRHHRPEYNSIEEVFTTTLRFLPEGITAKRIELPHTGASVKTVFNNLVYAWRHRGAVNHITGDVHYIALATGRNTVLTIHDAYSILKGSWLKQVVFKLLWFWLPALCVKKITVISPTSKKEIERIIPFAKNKIEIIPNPCNPDLSGTASLKERKRSDKPVIFLLGTKPNKNLERTVEALSVMDVKIIILGPLSSAQSDLLNEFKIDYENYFNIPFRAVMELYERCDLVCFASLYEGFGLPIIEAQVAGRPVVTSAVEPMNWVAGDAACLVDPYAISSIREGIRRVLDDKEYNHELIRKGKENAMRFDPATVAGLYSDLYKEM